MGGFKELKDENKASFSNFYFCCALNRYDYLLHPSKPYQYLVCTCPVLITTAEGVLESARAVSEA